MYHFEVMELCGLGSPHPSYGILASVLEGDACTYIACIPDISRDKVFVDGLVHCKC